MSGKPGVSRVKKVMVQAMNLMFNYLKGRDRVLIWLYENTGMKIEGIIVGFDEYMNIVLEDAFEVYTKTGVRRPLGRIMLKGDCVTLIQKAQPDMDST